MIDRREHRRYQAKSGSFALLRSTSIELSKIRDVSLGEIGFGIIKSKPVKMGQIINISMDGMAFDYIGHKDHAIELFKLDLLFAEDAFYLGRLLFKTIFDYEIVSEIPLNNFTIRRCGVQFGEFTYQQKTRLEYFLCNHAVGELQINPDFQTVKNKRLKVAIQEQAASCFV